MRTKTGLRGLLLALGVLTPVVAAGGIARAQNVPNPAFGFDKPPEKPADWKVQSKGGALLTTGNGESKVGTLAVDGSRQAGDNKLSLAAAIAYGRSSVRVPVLPAAGTEVSAIGRNATTSTNEWKSRGRYDRFFTPNNSGYALGQIGADRIAGKRLYGGGQLGYSRQLLKNEQHTLVAELGYDFSYESYVAIPMKTLDAVQIHSARVFAGELYALSKETGLSANIEALFNLNKETGALDASNGTKGVAAFKDTRIIGKAGLTTLLRKSLSIGVGFTLKYDQNPAPISPALPAGYTYAATFQPFAEKVDTLTEATLIYTFL